MALVAGGIILLAVVAVSAWLAGDTSRNVDDAIRAQDLRAATIDFIGAMTDAETAQRGFLLTGKEAYLAPLEGATQRLPLLGKQLLELAPAGSEIARQGAKLVELGREKLAELQQTVALAKAGRRDDALAIVQTDVGHTIMDRARRIAADAAQIERASLTRALDRSRSGARLLLVVDVAAGLLLSLLTLLVFESFRRAINRIVEQRAALETANASLAASREEVEQRVRERTAELSEANAEIQRFAYIVSHDLRAPLLNIIGFTGELENATSRLNRFVTERIETGGIEIPEAVRAASEEDLPEAIRFIQTSTAKMDRLINAILRLSREGRRVLTPERLDMRELLATLADSLKHQADEAGGEVVIGEVPAIVSDRLAVEQIFANLVENALKYTAESRPPRIEIAGRNVGGIAEFTVSDNGRGIAPRDLARIFELFRRAGKQDRAGEGIGLAHVKALVRRLGGTIDCTSTPDVGSTFTVRLPRVLAVATGERKDV